MDKLTAPLPAWPGSGLSREILAIVRYTVGFIGPFGKRNHATRCALVQFVILKCGLPGEPIP